MTVICWDGKTLAADSRQTCGTQIVSDKVQKLYSLPDVEYFTDRLYAIGLAGASSDVDLYIAYITSEGFPAKSIEHNASGIILGRKYVYTFEKNKGFLIRYDKKTKLGEGCGGCLAASAMELGCDAVEAVRHAIKLDTSCGGKIRTIKEDI